MKSGSYKIFVFAGLAGFLVGGLIAAPGANSSLGEEEHCRRGSDRACRSLGIEAQKSGDYERAFDYLKIACEDHPPRGALFTCTNYFAVAKQLGRLDTAPVKLESRCAAGDQFICYHLARAYREVEMPDDVHRILEPLCEENFNLPFNAAFGPCMDLGQSLETAGDLERAAYFFKLDCDRDTNTSRLSCSSYDYVDARLHPKTTQRRQPINEAFFLVLAMPVLSLILFMVNGRVNLRIVQWAIPVLTILAWAVWESRLESYDIRVDLLLILPAVAMVILMAFLARRKLKKRLET